MRLLLLLLCKIQTFTTENRLNKVVSGPVETSDFMNGIYFLNNALYDGIDKANYG